MPTTNGRYRNQILGYVIAALLGGSAGSFGLRVIVPPRDDPFYGREGRQLTEQVKKLDGRHDKHEMRVDNVEKEIIRLNERVRGCLSQLTSGKSRAHDKIVELEHKVERLEWDHERLKEIGILGITTDDKR